MDDSTANTKLKLIVAFLADDKTSAVVHAARDAGATGATIIPGARGEGRTPQKTFLGLEIAARRDVALFVVAETLARHILECIRDAGRFDNEAGSGIAFQLDIEDAVGLGTQLPTIRKEVEGA